MEGHTRRTPGPHHNHHNHLRAALRHEQHTVATVLSAALHHSAQVGADVLYAAPRSQKTDRTAGRRPGDLKEPEPPWVVEHAVCPCSGALLLVVPSLAAAESDGVDTTLKYLLKLALKEREEEEEKERKRLAVQETLERARPWAEEKERRRVVHEEAAATLEQARVWAEEKAKRRKRKKRRKRRTPRTSSRSLRGLARRRQRQCLACNAGFPGDVPLRSLGRRESDSQVFCHLIHCMQLCGMDRHVIQPPPPQPQPPPPQPQPRPPQPVSLRATFVSHFGCGTLAVVP